MIEIRKATPKDVDGICKVCTEGYRATYGNLKDKDYVEGVIRDFYNIERVSKEVQEINHLWNGYFVAVSNGQVIGAGGGGFLSETECELYVLYLDPTRKREGIGSKLLEAITKEQIDRGGLIQWVSVAKGNEMGIPFYEAAGFDFVEERPDYYRQNEGDISLRYKRKIG